MTKKKRKSVKKAPAVRRGRMFKAKKRKVVHKPKKLGASLPWRVAYSLEQLLAQANERVPNRNKSSDGSIGDARHQQSPSSDHNPFVRDNKGQPVVRARDFTNDPKGGFVSSAFAQSLAKSKDPRISYIIDTGRIWNRAQGWHKYNGQNPHDHHAHVSVVKDQALYDSKKPWTFDVTFKDENNQPVTSLPGDRPVQDTVTDPVLRKGSKGDPVRTLQTMLGVQVDGDFGPATERAVKSFQTLRGLVSDGVVGPATWRALRAAKAVAPNVPATTPPVNSLQSVREFIFSDEGRELTVHSDEPGGASRLGISIDTLSRVLGRQATKQDLLDMSEDQAWDIYNNEFASKIHADKLAPGLNYAALDFAINSGPAVVDGDPTNNPRIVQDFLVTAMKEPTVQKQIEKLCDLRIEYMKTNPVKWARYNRGWTKRVALVENRSLNMAS